MIVIALLWCIERAFDMRITGYARDAASFVYRQVNPV
jgi:hypothetical protein